jgi:hypothetical protein
MEGIHPTIFESFNARALDFVQVAETFVAPPDFSEAVKRCHTVILGPRGSGKTTILKMMHPQALDAWASEEASLYRPVVDFSGVFIPADRTWSEQIQSAGAPTIAQQDRDRFGIATFTTHVLRSLVETMRYRSDPRRRSGSRSVELDRNVEAEIVTEIAKRWYLPLGVPSFLSLKHALTDRLSKIWEFIDAEKQRSEAGRGDRIADEKYFGLNYLSSAESAVELFNDATGEETAKWGLLFDELEIVPDVIRKDLLDKTRSSDNRFIFKLSMSPFDRAFRFFADNSSSAGNDYNQIPLWYAHKENGKEFCDRLFRSLAIDIGLPDVSPDDIFEKTEIEKSLTEVPDGHSPYEVGFPLQRAYAELAEKDESFRRFLEAKKIDLNALEALSESNRAATIRKIRSIVPFRNEFIKANEGEPQTGLGNSTLRSRKNTGIYSGAETLYAIVEGNPRWFAGIIGRLIQDYSRTKTPIDQSGQNIAVNRARNRFRAYLRTIPSGDRSKGKQSRGLLSILDDIGEYFSHATYKLDFSMEPPLTFSIDSHIDADLEGSLGRALNAGAIFYVNDPDGDLILNRLRGKRFRLSYLLATEYNLPLILGRKVSVSYILAKGSSRDALPLFG